MPKRTRLVACLTAAVVAAAIAGTPSRAAAQEPVSEETISYFRTNCTSCHTIGGGPLSGPDLKDVHKRRTREQLAKFIVDPKAAIDGGDPYWVKLWNDARGVVMPAPAGITADRVAKLLDLIEAESALPKSRFAGMTTSDRALTAADVAAGRRLFEGTQPFTAGAPSCLSCHTVRGVSGFGGGRLAPDLTDVFSRLGGRKSLAAWLSAPQSPTMAPVYAGKAFTDDETLALVAFLQDRAAQPGEAGAAQGTDRADGPGAGIFEFLAAGVGGLALLLGLFDFLWRDRFRGVRRAMVEGSRR